MTTTRLISPLDAVDADDTRPGLFDRAFRRFLAARKARARHIAYQHLSRLSEGRLVELGFEPAEIRQIRAHAGMSTYYWS